MKGIKYLNINSVFIGATVSGTSSQPVLESLVLLFMDGHPSAVADPGFPVGRLRPRKRRDRLQGSYVAKILYVKTKESGPLGFV